VKRKHVPVLDGIRGLAIIAVLCRHVAYVFEAHGPFTRWFLPIPKFGSRGVDLFFVLSGFLITGILLDTKSAGNRATSFYGRRVLRIFPIYYLALAVVFVGEHFSIWIKDAGNLQNPLDHISYLLYFQNFTPLWHHGEYPLGIFGPFWSLAVEEQFYLIIFVPIFGSALWIYAFTFTRADGLFVGAALAVILAAKGEFPKSLVISLASAGVGLLAVIPIFVPARELWETGRLEAVLGTSGAALCSGALIAYCLTYQESRLARWFQADWLRNFGKYSYGIYVIHATVYHAGETFLAARGMNYPFSTPFAFGYAITLMAIAYGLAWLSFNFFESRFLDLKRYFEPVFPKEKAEELYEAGVAVH
jgi:peptidoglycan/LPS O-acetylase OafA/YrhL